MTEAKCLLDTNLWVYLYSSDHKSLIVENLIHTHFDDIVVSTQVLNELYNSGWLQSSYARLILKKELKPLYV